MSSWASSGKLVVGESEFSQVFYLLSMEVVKGKMTVFFLQEISFFLYQRKMKVEGCLFLLPRQKMGGT